MASILAIGMLSSNNQNQKNMYYLYSGIIEKSQFILTDLNYSSFNKRIGKGNYYKIIWAKEKDISIEIDGYHITLKKDHLLFCTPLNSIHVKPYTQGAICFVFSKEFYCMRGYQAKSHSQDYLFQRSFISPSIKLNENDTESFNCLFSLFQEEFDRKDRLQGEMLMVLLKKLLITLKRMTKKNESRLEISNDKSNIISEFNYLVESHFKDKHKVSDYAYLLNKSPKTISNLFKKHCEKTALSFINERILIEARRLLMFSDKTAVEIAYELGYNEPGHFSKFFKNQLGFSPIEFRKRNYASAS